MIARGGLRSDNACPTPSRKHVAWMGQRAVYTHCDAGSPDDDDDDEEEEEEEDCPLHNATPVFR